jgi:hypothetical protein
MYVIRFLARRIGGAGRKSDGIAKSNSTEVGPNFKILTRKESRSNFSPHNGSENRAILWVLPPLAGRP